MVWLHGGAFSYGSANSPRYDGSNLARRNDVVVVAVNHRLNIFGHLDLSGIGDERFAQSGNAGVLDLVAALEWVREHAARFGGDPGNVTIFGQSGGGGKVSALLAMPARQGALPQGDHPERRQRALRRARAHDAPGRRRAEASRTRSRTNSTPCRRCRWRACRKPSRRRRRRCRARAMPLLDRYNFGPVIDGQRAARPSLRSRRPRLVGRHTDHDRRDQGRVGDLPGARRRRVEPHRSARRSCASASPRSPATRPTACWPTTSGAIRPRRRPIG